MIAKITTVLLINISDKIAQCMHGSSLAYRTGVLTVLCEHRNVGSAAGGWVS